MIDLSIDDVQMRNIKHEKWMGICLGVMLNANFISLALSNIFLIDNLFVIMLVAFSLVAIVVNYKKIKFRRIHIIVLAILGIQLLFGQIFVSTDIIQHYFLCLIGIAFPCLIVSQYSFNTNVAMKTILITSLFLLGYYFILLNMEYTVYNSEMQMGVAYALLPTICASFYFLFKGVKRLDLLLVIALLVISLLVLFKLSTRGAYLCAFIYVLGCIVLKTQKNITKRMLVILLLSFGLCLSFYFFGERLFSSNWFFSVFGRKSNDILNGRNIDYSIAFSWRGLGAFLFGSGIGSCPQYIGSNYIHNLFGQVLFEQGVYSLVFVGYIVIKGLKTTFYKSSLNLDQKLFLFFLICVGIVRLMVSYYYWIDQFFWFFMWLILGGQYQETLQYTDFEEKRNAC